MEPSRSVGGLGDSAEAEYVFSVNGRTPFQGSRTHFLPPRVARRLATLGFEAKSRWDKALNTYKGEWAAASWAAAGP